MDDRGYAGKMVCTADMSRFLRGAYSRNRTTLSHSPSPNSQRGGWGERWAVS